MEKLVYQFAENSPRREQRHREQLWAHIVEHLEQSDAPVAAIQFGKALSKALAK